MKAHGNNIIVVINRQEQEKRKELLPGIKIADTYQYMKYYLQVAPIYSIGLKVKINFPELETGDYLIFHHTVEDDEWRLLRQTETEEYRAVKCEVDDVYGVQKQDDLKIIPFKEHIWCTPPPTLAPFKELWRVNEKLLVPVGDHFETAAHIRERIEQLQEQQQFCSGPYQGEMLANIRREQKALTEKLNTKMLHRMQVVYINPMSGVNVSPGDFIYMQGYIDYKGYELSVTDIKKENGELVKGEQKDFYIIRLMFAALHEAHPV